MLNFIRTGPQDAQTVIFVHAIGLDLTYWESQIAALSEKFDVVAYDLCGHGASATLEKGYELADHAQDLARIIKGLGPDRAHIVGLSLGGMIAQTLAITKPELVKSLTLIDTISTFSDELRLVIQQRAETTRQEGMPGIVEQAIERWFTPGFVSRRPEVIDRVTKTLLANSKDAHAAVWDSISRLDLAADLSTIRCPTMVIVGEDDTTTPVAASQFIAQQITDSSLHVLAETSHMAPIEKPSEINTRLIDFLQSI